MRKSGERRAPLAVNDGDVQPCRQRFGQLLGEIASNGQDQSESDVVGGERRWLRRQGYSQRRVARRGDDAAAPIRRRLVDQPRQIGDALRRRVAADRAHRLSPVGGVDPAGDEMRHEQARQQDQHHLAEQRARQPAASCFAHRRG